VFFQAEDGIRVRNVTGVQTCALPIFGVTGASGAVYAARTLAALLERGVHVELIVSDYGRRLLRDELGEQASIENLVPFLTARYEIGRAACRGRGLDSGGCGTFEKRHQ